jgi:hypothetical protein
MRRSKVPAVVSRVFLTILSLLPGMSLASPPRPPHAEIWGINAHVPGTAELNAADELGVRYIRVDFNWDQMEPAQNSFNWGPWDNVVNGAVARGMGVFATLAYTPSWANGGKDHTYPPTDVNDWRDFVFRVGQRYADRVDHWGMWNEPNLDDFFSGTAQDYVNKILIPGAEEIVAADPVAIVCAPELAPTPGDFKWNQWMNTVLGQAGSYIDRVTLHEYKDTPAESFQKLDTNVPRMLAKYGMSDVEVWLTEIGWASDRLGEDTQNENYAELVRWVACSDYITKVFPYELKDDPTPSVPKWGLVRSDNSRKPGFYTYQDFVLHAGSPYDCSGLNYPPLCGALPGHRTDGDVAASLLVLLAPLGLTGLLRRRRRGGNRSP